MQIKQFQSYCSNFSPYDYTDYRLYLKAIYEHIKKETQEPWSYVYFSKYLGLGKGNAYYLIVSGKRRPNETTAKTLAKKIGLEKGERRFFLALVEFQHAKDDVERESAFEKMLKLKSETLKNSWDKQTVEFFGEWYYSAIYEILSLEDAEDDPDWLLSKMIFRIPKSKVLHALDHLQEMNLIKYDLEKKRLVPTHKSLVTGPEAQGVIFSAYHQQMIGLALDYLVNGNPYEREISSVSLPISQKNFDKIVQKAREFHKEIIELSKDEKETDKVLQINTQIFPLSK